MLLPLRSRSQQWGAFDSTLAEARHFDDADRDAEQLLRVAAADAEAHGQPQRAAAARALADAHLEELPRR